MAYGGLEPRALGEERQRIIVDDLADQIVVVSPTSHLEDELGDGERVAVSPVAGRVDHDPVGAVDLDHVGGPGGRALGDRVERHAHPVAGVERVADGVFLDVVDADPLGLMRRSSRNMSRIIRVPWYLSARWGVWTRTSSWVRAARSRCSRKTVASLRVFLFRPISPMPRTSGAVEKLGDHRDHLARKRDILGLLGVDAEPGVMLDAVSGGPLRLVLGQLAKIVAKAFRRPSGRIPPRTPAR